ncbi:membrane-bound O-acyltransferase domain-containing protein 2-like [Sinocyclocheilus rhinocerous]|uniref:membrane-bound O-acyltransferase domain-containing protein 2-like n=1 Tax=Sinocyclocheilus rhinocerous TaxID=307959 RepID=UPI0007B9687B|nr:PREDICTED: membrane-bound O-acyltransferase domain-containing protein 2-like [Sinocyclocheilus rhinocerous]
MATSTSCTGSTLLQPISKIIDLPLDQVNFVVCQLFALVTAFWFRLYLHPSKTSPFIRHVVATLLGFYLALFCFGWYALHFLVQSGLAYGIMIFTGVEHMHKYCFVVTLGYLCFCQVTRAYVFDYGMYSADFTGPMMVITQKITSLAFEIHDGLMKREEHLKPSQKYLAVRKMPSLLEYLSYNCNFMGILAGPTCSYNDYIAFIEGRWYEPKHLESNGKENGRFKQSDPSPKRDVIQKVCTCALSLMVYLVIFFHSFTADAINNAAGFGFNGYNADGTPKWDRISNLRILNIEFATSFKMFLDNWNIQTALWLKRVCYERCPYNPTAATFLLSAIWHGADPGYYLTFITGIVVTMAARAVRHNVRQHFLGSATLKLIYDVITWFSTQMAICYTVVPFVLLAVGPSLKFYSSWYCCIHLICVLLVLVLPVKSRRTKQQEQPSSVQANEQNCLSSPHNNCNQKQKAT